MFPWNQPKDAQVYQRGLGQIFLYYLNNLSINLAG